MQRATALVVLLVGTVLFSTWAQGDESAPKSETQSTHVIRSAVIGSAGAPVSSGGYTIESTLGQPHPTGVVTESGNTHYAGFWRVWTGTVWTGIDDDPLAFTNKLFQNYYYKT